MLLHTLAGAGGASKPPVEIVAARSAVYGLYTGLPDYTLTSPSYQKDDMIVLWHCVQLSGTAPATSPGYTSIFSANDPTYKRSFRLQYKIATSSGTDSIFIDNDGSNKYIIYIVLRNATRIGVNNFVNTGSSYGAVVPLPDMTGLNTTGRGMILAGPYYFEYLESPTSPYLRYQAFLKATLGTEYNTGKHPFVYVQNNTNSSLVSKTVTVTGGGYFKSWALEVL
jgi:hypothetical protein